MGNQHTIDQNGVVFQNNGQYIIPNKLNHGQSGQEEEIVNNIFGINDPTLLTRSFWAKEEGKSPINEKDDKSPARSRMYTESLIRDYKQYEPEMNGHYDDQIGRRQDFRKSIVNDFRVEQIIEPSQVRNLSKNTSYSIIQKLNKYDDEIQSQSPYKNSQLSKTNELRFSKFTKNKENFNYLLGSGSKNNSQSKVNQRQRKSMQRTLSEFKGTQKFSNQNSTRKVLDDVTLRSRINNIFGLESIQQERCEQLTDRLEQQLKSMRKTEVGQQRNRFSERQQKNEEVQQRSWNYQLKQQQSRGQNQFCQQTFSRFEEQTAYPAYLQKVSDKQNSEKFSQKTGLKKQNIQKYRGLNEDSHNESLMKVMKRITDLNLTIEDHEDRKSAQTIKINRPVNQDVSEIMNENSKWQKQYNQSLHSKKDQSVYSKQNSSQKSSKKYYQSPNQGNNDFKFDLKQVNCSQKSSKSQISQHQQKSQINQQLKHRMSQQQYESNQSNQVSNKSSKQQSSKSSPKYHFSKQTSNRQLADPSSISNNFCLQNDIYQSQSSQGLDDVYSDKFRFPKNLSPKSLAAQQRILTRQRSCSGRLIETSKLCQKRQSQKSYKNFDFSKKSLQYEEQNRSIYSRKHQPDQSHKNQKLSTKDYQLLMKISTLQQELKRLKSKEQLQKFQSRRYSPVKQQRMKMLRHQTNDNGSENEQDTGVQQSKYCINDITSTKPLKRRSQYFKLKIK